MTMDPKIPALLDLLSARHSFLITSHERPDGDAIGSALGLMHLLDDLGKQSTVVFRDPIPAAFRTLPGVDRIVTGIPSVPAEAAILLECSAYTRASMDAAAFLAARPPLTINIDHHRSGKPFADFNWIDPEVCAVGAMIYQLAIAGGLRISAAAATCLYTAVLTDTGSFHYEGTGASTFALAQHLVEAGANPTTIAQDVYCTHTPGRVRLLGNALDRIQIELPLAWTTISLADIERAGGTTEDTEGIVNHLIAIAGVEAAAFFREVVPGAECRISLRSKGKLDVSKVAEQFAGGGHRNASGCTFSGSLADAPAAVIGTLRTASLQPAPPQNLLA
jgi:phosphoesterase RecJ-like protein